MRLKIILAVLFNIKFLLMFSQTTVISNNSTWKYLDNGSNPGTTWKSSSFNDASWASGISEFGYGDGDETTVVNACGNAVTYPGCSNKYMTTYFRKVFAISNASSFSTYTLNFKRDDGIIIYINGDEVFRNNMPNGTISYTTPAATACSDDGMSFLSTVIPGSVVATGTNVVAVEIHQNAPTSSDLTFQFNMVGSAGSSVPGIVKGPYLQIVTPTT